MKKPMSLSVEESLIREVDEAALNKGQKRSEFVVEAIKEKLAPSGKIPLHPEIPYEEPEPPSDEREARVAELRAEGMANHNARILAARGAHKGDYRIGDVMRQRYNVKQINTPEQKAHKWKLINEILEGRKTS